MLELRPHHGICIGQFIGKGYSDEFIENMTQIIARLESSKEERIRLVCHADAICRACPRRVKEECHSGQKVMGYDITCLNICGLSENEEISWREFKNKVKDLIIDKDKLKEVCIDCSWLDICEKIQGHKR